MFIVYDNDGQITEVVQVLEPFAVYAKASLNTAEVSVEPKLPAIYNSGVYVPRPTAFHVASKYKWVITPDNYLILSQTINMICTQILTRLTCSKSDDLWFSKINSAMLESNRVKAFLALQELVKDAPSYVNVDHYFI